MYDPAKFVNAKLKNNMYALEEKIMEYIKETNDGTDIEAINKWDNNIQTELKGLEAFK